jgi:ATP-dependent exoDNAse (exonuclease V) beta subunit
VRTNDQGVKISDFLNKKDIDIISSETLLISKSEEVEFIIAILKFCSQPNLVNSKLDIINYLHRTNNLKKSKHFFIKGLIKKNKKEFFKELHKLNLYFDYNILTKSSLYEAIEYIIYAFKLSKKSNNYIQFFLDFTFDYSNKNFANTEDFINHYESKKDTLSIVAPEQSDAVKIMTIHKSKGLEFPIVIYAYADIDVYKEKDAKEWYPVSKDEFNGFNNLLLNFNKDFEFFGDIGNLIYKTHQMNLELDNINLLYVALTRAQNELHIICSNSCNKKGEENLKKYSGMFINYLKKNDLWNANIETFEFGQKIKKDISTKKLNTSLIDEFIINPKEVHDINIDAKSAKIWGTSLEEATNNGNLLHEIMSKIKSKQDLERVLKDFYENGTINTILKEKYRQLIIEILDHEKLSHYYNPDLKSYNEKDIILKNSDPIRADRIVFNSDKEICVIDYKTGKLKKEDYDQINSYELVLSNMGYTVKDKIIINTANRLEVIKF